MSERNDYDFRAFFTHDMYLLAVLVMRDFPLLPAEDSASDL